MTVDYPRAWQIARTKPASKHHRKCSYRVTSGCVLCDCDVLMKHPDVLDSVMQGLEVMTHKPTRAQNITITGPIRRCPRCNKQRGTVNGRFVRHWNGAVICDGSGLWAPTVGARSAE